MDNSHIKDIYQAFDAKDIHHLEDLLTDDVWVRFGNAKSVMGKDHVIDSLTEFFAAIGESTHNINSIWYNDNQVGVEARAAYTRKDNKVVSIPTFAVWKFGGIMFVVPTRKQFEEAIIFFYVNRSQGSPCIRRYGDLSMIVFDMDVFGHY